MANTSRRQAWSSVLGLLGAVAVSALCLGAVPAAHAEQTRPAHVVAAQDDCTLSPALTLDDNGASAQFKNDLLLPNNTSCSNQATSTSDTGSAADREDQENARHRKQAAAASSGSKATTSTEKSKGSEGKGSSSGASNTCADIPEAPKGASEAVLEDIQAQKQAQRYCLDKGQTRSTPTGTGTGAGPDEASSSDTTETASGSSSKDDSEEDSEPKKCKGADIPDKEGICASRFSKLAINRGDVGTPLIMASGIGLDLGWAAIYQIFNGDVHLIDWIYGFTWVDWIGNAIKPITTNISAFFNKFGAGPFAMSLSALVYAVYWFRGHRSRAITGIFVVALVASLATTFSSPTDKFLGSNGLFSKFKDVGNELVVAATTTDKDQTYTPGTGAASNNVMLDHAVGPQMVETMLRGPNQVISFGKVFTGKCVDKYNKALNNSKNLTENNYTRKEARKCDKKAEEFNKGNEWSRYGTLFGTFIMFGGFSILLWGVFALLIFNLLIACWHMITLAWKFFRGLFPGGNPSDVLHNLISIGLTLFMIAISGLFLAVALVAAQSLITGLLNMGTWVYGIVGWAFLILVIVFAIMWIRAHRAHRRLGDKLRQALRGREKTKTTSVPQRLQRGANNVRRTIQQRRMTNAIRGTHHPGTPTQGGMVRTAVKRYVGPIGPIGTLATVGGRALKNKLTRHNTPTDTPNTPTTDTPVTTPTNTTPTDEPTPPRSPKTQSMKDSLTAVAKRNPTAAVMIQTGSNLRKANATQGSRRQRAAAVAAQAKVEASRWKDPLQRNRAKTQAMREHLAAVSAQQEHKAGQRRTKVVDHEARQAERAQVRAKKVRNREVSNEFSRTRANLPAFDAEHEKQVKAAQQRIQDLSGAERRKAVLKQRLAEAEYRQKRLEQAKAEAEATVEAKSTVTAPVRRS
jgi:hypothetical protein